MASQSHNISTALKRKISTNSSDEPEQKKAGEESLLSIDDKFDKGHGELFRTNK